MFRTALVAASVAVAASTTAHAASLTNTLPVGTLVDLTGFMNEDIIDFSTNASPFTDAGIASITVTNESLSNEFYNPGMQFGAGRALFNTSGGDLVVLDENTTAAFGAATFTIDFAGPVTAFGFRLADTDDRNTPIFTLFRGGSEIDEITFNGIYNAQTQFGLADVDGFDRVVISTTGTDGYGVTDLTVGPSGTAVIPVPAALPLLLTGALALFGVGRHRNR